MIKTAVILAAGMGSRLGNRASDRPKGFLVLDHTPIIEHSIKKLLKLGIEKFFIGTGFHREMYEALSRRYPSMTCVNNAEYESSGSMRTMYTLKNEIEDDFILLESDLIYEQRILNQAVENHNLDVLLASERTFSSDEVFIEVNEKGSLRNLSKNPEEIEQVYGELIGITKLSYGTYQKMCSFAETMLPLCPKMDYEQALVGISKDVDIVVNKVDRMAWCEVDDENHWRRAVEVIYPIIKAHEAVSGHVKRNILLNPGPATTTESVKYAQIVPDICPREQEFGEVMQYISKELTKFAANDEEYTTVLFAGSGTAAVESVISSVIGDKGLVIINNGAYGMRMIQIAETYNLPYYEFNSSFDEAIDLVKLEEFMIKIPQKISHLAIVHNETTTGLLNPIEKVGEICSQNGIVMIVDAMSSFAAIPIDMKKMNIGYLAASSNKNLQGIAGVSFVIANNKELEQTQHIKPRNLYLNLYSQYVHFSLTKQMRFTPPVQILYALKQAIIETKWEGIENRYRRYSELWEVLIEGITRLGLTYLVHPQNHSRIITSIVEPKIPSYNFNKMHDFFYERGFTIYPGKFGQLSTFRIANIGDINKEDIEMFISLLKEYLQEI